MKKFFSALLALFSSISLAATTVPVQLLNPTGSSSGQAIVSTGASSAPAWGGIGVNGIGSIAANTVLANVTGASASPTAFAMPSCSASGNALLYASGTGFQCGTGYALLGGATFTGAVAFSGGITGVTNGSSASSGQVGYAPSATQSSAQSMTTSTAMNIVTLSLPAGDYDVSGVGCLTASGNVTNMTVGISTTSATLGALGTYAGISFTIAGNGGGSCFTTPPVPLQLSTTTTVYLIGLGAFSSGTMTSTGKISARVRR